MTSSSEASGSVIVRTTFRRGGGEGRGRENVGVDRGLPTGTVVCRTGGFLMRVLERRIPR